MDNIFTIKNISIVLITSLILFLLYRNYFIIEKFTQEEIYNILLPKYNQFNDNQTVEEILIYFNTSVAKPLEERLKTFKTYEGLNNLLKEKLYFNLRMNREDVIRKNIIKWYIIFNNYIKDNNLEEDLINDFTKNIPSYSNNTTSTN